MLSSVSVDFRIAFLSEHQHRPEARQWGSVIKERLPKSKGFCWKGYSWSRNWSPEELGRRQTVEGGDWADVILRLRLALGMGSNGGLA
jgi:hypothetical protein